MTGFWLGSYVVLWLVVLAQGMLLVGVLIRSGLPSLAPKWWGYRVSQEVSHEVSQGRSGRSSVPPIPALQDDGPPIGSPLPTLRGEATNGYGLITDDLLRQGSQVLLVFLSPLCEGCQRAVEALNKLVAEGAFEGRAVALLRSDEHTGKAFLALFPLRIPVLLDNEGALMMELNVHRSPFGLLYDAQGLLLRKATLLGDEEMRALLGATDVSETARDHVVGPPTTAETTAEVALAAPSAIPSHDA